MNKFGFSAADKNPYVFEGQEINATVDPTSINHTDKSTLI